MPTLRRPAAIAVLVGLLALAEAGLATERDLYTGLALLRAGAQSEAALDLMRYRDASTDPEVRRKIDHVLPLLKQPLPQDVREYIAVTLEPGSRAARPLPDGPAAAYWLRVFPVFP